jgi:hypothetical protein
MKTRILVLGLTLGFLALGAAAQTATETVFKVKLFGGLEILSATAPMPSGSMLLVKNLSDGSLTAVPAELVASVSKTRAGAAITMKDGKTLVPASRLVTVANSATGPKSVVVMPGGQKVSISLTAAKAGETLSGAGVPATLAGGKGVTIAGSVSAAKTRGSLAGAVTAARLAAGLSADSVFMTALSPGQTVVLGSTGGTTARATETGTTIVSSGAAISPLSANAFARAVEDQIFVGDLQRLTPTAGLAVGMVAPTTGEVVIGPNGFPVPVSSTSPAGAGPLGPNGFPPSAAARGGASRGVAPNGLPTTGTTVSATAPTSAGGTIATAVPVTVSPATAAAAGALATPGTAVGTTGAAAPAAAPPR